MAEFPPPPPSMEFARSHLKTPVEQSIVDMCAQETNGDGFNLRLFGVEVKN